MGSTLLPFLRHAEGAAGHAAGGLYDSPFPRCPHVLVPSHPLPSPKDWQSCKFSHTVQDPQGILS